MIVSIVAIVSIVVLIIISGKDFERNEETLGQKTRFSSSSDISPISSYPEYYDCDFCIWSTYWLNQCDDSFNSLPIPGSECDYLQSFGAQWNNIGMESCRELGWAMGGLPPDNQRFYPLNGYNHCYNVGNRRENFNMECALCGFSVMFVDLCLDEGGQDSFQCFWDDLWENYFEIECVDYSDCVLVGGGLCGSDGICEAVNVDADMTTYFENTGWCFNTARLQDISTYCGEIVDSCLDPFFQGVFDQNEQSCYNSIYGKYGLES